MDILNEALLKLKKLEGETERLKIVEKRQFLDEDDMTSDSALAVASQQSIKAYVDDNIITDHGALSGLADDDHPQYVHDTGNETIAGIKTFSSIPELPASNPTTDNQAARKAYVDSWPKFVPLTTPLTSTSWDGDARSTTAKTLIDLSAVFGAPAGIKAVDFKVMIRDSASASYQSLYIILGPDNTAYKGKRTDCGGKINDATECGSVTVPCDANGDIYYQIVASGAGTMDVWLEIWGYWV